MGIWAFLIVMFLRILVLFTVIANNPDDNCGRSFVRKSRIVGGELAAEGEFPWAVSLLFNGFHYCGGSVLSSRWVLTAAHCLTSYVPNNFAVRVGFHQTGGTQLSSQIFRVDKVFLHPRHKFYLPSQSFYSKNSVPRYSRFSMPYTYDHDIALILLTTSLEYGALVQPVCLPEERNLTDILATAVGWGYVQDSSIPQSFSSGLRKVQVPIVDYQQCQEWYAEAGKVGVKLSPNQICAGYKGGGKDACLGDSGGPLTIAEEGRHIIVGVISAGIGCARPLLPGIYTRVSAYVDWLKTSITLTA